MTEPPELPFGQPTRSSPSSSHQILTVSELTADIHVLLESNYPEIWIEGEISNARVWKTGHLYFTLKDTTSQLKAVMFRSALRYLRFKPSDGQQVVARGRISVYEPKGNYQLVCEHLEPHGIGALQLAFDQLRERLDNEGLFDDARKRPLPVLPRKIGVVTSLDGAAIRDIINVLGRRYPNAHLVISPARVQGDGAGPELIRGLRQLGNLPDVDVIILTRGGGSLEDLSAFNEESVARAIIVSPIPVISAVGHETDHTISDFVSDLRAPTPSAAAELVVARKDEMTAHITRETDRLESAFRNSLRQRATVLHQLEARPGITTWPAGLAVRGRQIGALSHRLIRAVRDPLASHQRLTHALRLRLEALDLGRRVTRFRARLDASGVALTAAICSTNQDRRTQLQTTASELAALNPLAVLGRGYAVCWTADRSAIVRDAVQVAVGEEVRVTLHHGELACEVKKAE